MKNYFIAKNFSVFIGVIAAALFFAVAPRAFALSYSPSTIYPGTPYTLYESVSNSNGSTISVTKDCFYWKITTAVFRGVPLGLPFNPLLLHLSL